MHRQPQSLAPQQVMSAEWVYLEHPCREQQRLVSLLGTLQGMSKAFILPTELSFVLPQAAAEEGIC